MSEALPLAGRAMALLAEQLRDERAEVQRLRTALEWIDAALEHDGYCKSYLPSNRRGPCNCGIEEIKAVIQEALR